jgi:hypothetical protein
MGVTTVTSTVPLPGGVVAVIWVSESTVSAGAPALPKSTAVAPVKPLPVIVTLSPPSALPLAGEIAVTCTAADTAGVSLGGPDRCRPD